MVNRPRADLLTEVHVAGWLAMVWTSLALVPNKRLIIEVPFVAAKAIPSRRLERYVGVANAVHQKNRQAAHSRAGQNAVIALLQLDEEPRAGDVPVAQQLSRGLRQTPCENTPQNVMWGPDPVKL